MRTKIIEGCLGLCNLYVDESLERELGPERFREFVQHKMRDLAIAELREDRRIKIENAKKRKGGKA